MQRWLFATKSLSQIFISEIFISKIFISGIFISKIFISGIFISKIFISGIFISKIFISRILYLGYHINEINITDITNEVFMSICWLIPCIVLEGLVFHRNDHCHSQDKSIFSYNKDISRKR